MAFNPQNPEGMLTLADWAKRLDPDGKVASIVEMLTPMNEILEDAVFLESNLPTGHRTTIRAGLPQPTWRLLNYGVPNTKSKTAQVTDAAGMLEDYAEVDKALADLNGNTAAFRLSEDKPHIDGLNIELASTLIYGDTRVDPERFLGFAPRYNSLDVAASKPAAINYMDQVIDMGGTGNNLTSMWLIVWGANTTFMFFPKGSSAGILHEDLGEQTLFDENGMKYQGYRTHYKFNYGLCVRDWRYIVRLANIDPTAMPGEAPPATPDGTIDWRKMIQAKNTVPSLGAGRAVFYAGRQVKTMLDIAAASKNNMALNIVDWAGQPVTTFLGIPIRQVDAILETESALV
jgi:hypothetical protein